MIASIQKLQTEKRASTFERVKGATAGSLIGGGVGAVSGAFAFMRTGPLGAAVGGTLGALLSVKHKYQICRVTLRDERKVVAVAATFLGAGRDFSTWIKDRVETYNFSRGIDYEVFPISGENPQGGRPTIDYALSIDMAKEQRLEDWQREPPRLQRRFASNQS